MTGNASWIALGAVALTLVVAGCTDDQDPEGAADLLELIEAENYQGWAKAPGYEDGPKPTIDEHVDTADIYVNPTVESALGESDLSEWPVGSIIVKDSFDEGDLDLIAAMEKRESGWFWAEWDTDGESLFSGEPSVCIDCHQVGSDFVRAFALP